MKAVKQFENAFGIRLTRKKHAELLVLLMSLELVLAFSYIGYLQIPPISVTTLHILVIVAAMLFGPWDATAVALVFVVTSIWKASVTSIEIGDIIFSPFLSGKPFASLIMAAGTRIAFAVIAGYLFRWFFSKKRKHRYIGITLIAVAATLIHSLLVYLCLTGFFGAAEYQTSSSFGQSLILNNSILYAVTIGVVHIAYKVLTLDEVKEFFRCISIEERETMSIRSRVVILFYVLLVLTVIFLVMHFLSRLGWYINKFGENASPEYLSWTYGLMLQFVAGFAGVFGTLSVIVKWIQEYYSSMTLEANIRARENAEIANKSKSMFLFNMSHDIRTPMNAIIGFTDKAIRHKDDPEILEDALSKASDASNYLLRIVNDILDMAKIESGNMELNEQVHRSAESADTVVKVFASEAAKKDITLHTSFEDISDEYLWCDNSRLGQIAANLISNSIKYTDPGGEIWYTVRQVPCEKPGYGRFISTVRDTGRGMTAEFLERIFDSFERDESAARSGEQGTGLGMSIVKNLVDMMGGSIDIQSEPGKGTQVDITLDHRIASPEEIAAYESRNSEQPLDGKDSLKGRRILLVEDNELNREIAQDILEEEGLLVDTAEDGDIAVRMVSETAERKDYDYYSAVLMDIQMPRMNGYEATEAIRSIFDPEGIHVPIIAMTANAFEEDRQNALNAGMDEHISKPINVEKLMATLKKFI